MILKGNKVHEIVEKPSEAMVNLISTGIYKLNPYIFGLLDEAMALGHYGLSGTIQNMLAN